MPARSDIDPVDIPALLPYLMIVEKVGEQFRYRLMGTALAREWGRDRTGGFVGSYLTDPGSAAAARALFERTFSTGRPVLITGAFNTASDAVHHMSLFLLPLSEDGAEVNMSVCSVIARFAFGVTASADWLKGAQAKVRNMVNVNNAPELEKLCLEWEQHCSYRGDRAPD